MERDLLTRNDLLQLANGNDEAIIVVDKRHIPDSVRTKDLRILSIIYIEFFIHCPVTPELLRLGTHKRTPRILGTIAEDLHLTRCAQVCFTGAEDDQAEQHWND